MDVRYVTSVPTPLTMATAKFFTHHVAVPQGWRQWLTCCFEATNHRSSLDDVTAQADDKRSTANEKLSPTENGVHYGSLPQQQEKRKRLKNSDTIRRDNVDCVDDSRVITSSREATDSAIIHDAAVHNETAGSVLQQTRRPDSAQGTGVAYSMRG